jgi:hypothetical protein
VNVRVVTKVGLAALVAALVVLPLAASGGAATSLTRVSQDNIVDGIGLHQSEQQSQMAAALGTKSLVGVFQVGRIFDGGASAIGWTQSVNGNVWKKGLIPLTVQAGGPSTGLGPVWRADDPVVAYDAKHATWIVVSRGLVAATGASQGLYVNTSSDGTSWSAPALLHAAGSGDAPDKPSVTCDNSSASGGYGNCYVAWTNTASTPANQLQFSRTTDGGSTFSTPVGSSDTSVGTGSVALVQPVNPAAANSSTCGRVVVSYAGSTTNISDIASSDCGVTFGPHVSVATVATHTVAQGLRTSLLPSASMDKSGAIYLSWQTRSFRITQTTLSAAANAGDTNIKVGSVTGMTAGNTLTVDTGASAETVTITTVGTAGATGTGVTITPALASAHAAGAFVTVNGVPSTSTAAPNDIALSVMPGPTDATPAPAFAAPTRIAIESDAGATSNTVDHFVPAIAADPNANGKLALYYFFYPIAACNYVTGQPLDNTLGGAQCMPSEGYTSSTNGGTSWAAPQTLATSRSLAVLPRSNGGPDLGNVQGALVIPFGPNAGMSTAQFPVGLNVNGIDESLYAPSSPLAIASGS